MERFGSDKPDIRFQMELKELASYVERSDFKVFKSILENGGRVKGLVCPNASTYSRKVIDELTEYLKQYFINTSYLLSTMSRFYFIKSIRLFRFIWTVGSIINICNDGGDYSELTFLPFI